MDIGRLDRRIMIQRRILTTDETGAPVENDDAGLWEDLPNGAMFATYKPVKGDEKTDAAATRASVEVDWMIRFRDDLTPGENRIKYGDKPYDIREIQEIGRQDGLRLKTVLRDANNGIN